MTALQVLDTDTQEVVNRAPRRTGASKALRDLFEADWPDLPDCEDALKVLADLGIQCSASIYYIVRNKYSQRRKMAELEAKLAGEPPAAEPSPAVAEPEPEPLPPPPPAVVVPEELPPLMAPPPGGSMETLIRVWGWVEQIGGIDKMYHWLEFYEDFIKRFPR